MRKAALQGWAFPALLILAIGLSLGWTIGSANASVVPSKIDLSRVPTVREIDAAKALAPFDLELPTSNDLALLNFESQSLISATGGDQFTADAWYVDSQSGQRIHVWETNRTDLAALGKDPTVPLTPAASLTAIDGSDWLREVISGPPESEIQKMKAQAKPGAGAEMPRPVTRKIPLEILSLRRSDGVTISMDGMVSASRLRAIAQSME